MNTKTRIIGTLCSLTLLAGCSSGTLHVTAVASPSGSVVVERLTPDQIFLKEAGPRMSLSPLVSQYAIVWAHSACRVYATGGTTAEVESTLAEETLADGSRTFTDAETAQMVKAASDAYCPQYGS